MVVFIKKNKSEKELYHLDSRYLVILDFFISTLNLY